MDILPQPDGTTPTRIPFLPHYTWDYGDLANFPRRHGFCDASGDFNPEYDLDNVASLLQAWLFFGVLASKIGSGFDIQDFVRRDGLGREIVTLAPLKTLELSNREYTTSLPANYPRDITELNEFFRSNFRGSLLARNIPHIIEIYISTVCLFEVLNIRYFELIDHPIRLDLDLPPLAKIFLDQLGRTQWCAFNHKRLHSLQSITLQYITSINRENFPPFLTHKNCLEDSCKGNPNRTRHVEESCFCSFLGVSSADIAEIISHGSFPLIEIRETRSSDNRPHECFELRIIPWKRSLSYTAISHVWSHGLGNEHANSLPTCQLRTLLEAVNRAPGPRNGTRLIWIDTLCIPIPIGESYKAERTTTINKMGLIYAAAEKVLILDYELQRIAIKNLDMKEIIAHLLTCSWMERAWTFNEGSLSRSCYFQFADEAFEAKRVNEIWYQKAPQTLTEYLSHVIELDLARQCISEFNSTAYDHYKNGIGTPMSQGLDLQINGWNVLGCRSTTKPEDLIVILANLRGVNLSYLFEFDFKERLAVLISCQQLIPLSFLISPNKSEHKCLEEPNRWIPRSFDCSYISVDHLLECTPDGDGLKVAHKPQDRWGRSNYLAPASGLSLVMLPSSLEVSGKQTIQICADGHKTCLSVTFLRDSHPVLGHSESINFLMIEKQEETPVRPNSVIKGCCLRLPDPSRGLRTEIEQNGSFCSSLTHMFSENTANFRFAYDCPITASQSNSTSCGHSDAHQVTCPWNIVIQSNLSKYRGQPSHRENMSKTMTSAFHWTYLFLKLLGALSMAMLCLDLLIFNRPEDENIFDVETYQHYTYGAAIFLVLGWFWACIDFYTTSEVGELLTHFHGLIADIFIFAIVLRFSKTSMPSIEPLVFVIFDTFTHILSISYIFTLREMLQQYLFSVWLATWEDDWSPKTFNKWWWILFHWFGGNAPDTSQYELLSQVDSHVQ